MERFYSQIPLSSEETGSDPRSPAEPDPVRPDVHAQRISSRRDTGGYTEELVSAAHTGGSLSRKTGVYSTSPRQLKPVYTRDKALMQQKRRDQRRDTPSCGVISSDLCYPMIYIALSASIPSVSSASLRVFRVASTNVSRRSLIFPCAFSTGSA